MDCSFAQVPTAYPALYRIQLDQLKELQTLYTEVILPTVPISEVECALTKYVSLFIEPVGWRAIWRAAPRSTGLSFKCDLLVEVIDVGRNKLEALVIIQKVLSTTHQEQPGQADDSTAGESQAELDKLMANSRILTAPLVELHVLSEGDPEQAFLKSAIVIEHVRFFLKYVWRPWDTLSNETQLSEIFVETRLESRLNLYFDLRNNLIGGHTRSRIKQILADGWRTRHQLDDISRRQELSSENDDYAELGLDEVDMFEAIRLKVRLEDLDREMRMMEDPYLRMFAFCLRSSSQEEEQAKIELDGERVTHVVARQFNLCTLNQVTNFYAKSDADQQNKILFHNSVNAAIKAARSGHKIAILPGLYVCESLRWIEADIVIEGLSLDRSKTVLQAADGVDMFMHCSSQLVLRNLSFKCQFEADCILMVHSGLAKLENCCVDGSNCAKGAFTVLSKAHIQLDRTVVMSRELVAEPADSQPTPPTTFEANEEETPAEEKKELTLPTEQVEKSMEEAPFEPMLDVEPPKNKTAEVEKSFEFVSIEN